MPWANRAASSWARLEGGTLASRAEGGSEAFPPSPAVPAAPPATTTEASASSTAGVSFSPVALEASLIALTPLAGSSEKDLEAPPSSSGVAARTAPPAETASETPSPVGSWRAPVAGSKYRAFTVKSRRRALVERARKSEEGRVSLERRK